MAPGASARAHAILTGALIGWFSLVLLAVSILLSHSHHSRMSHGALLALAAVASVANGVALWLSRRDQGGTDRLTWAWAISLVAFFAFVTYFAGGFSSNLYALLFPVVVFAATVLPPGPARASGLAVGLLYGVAVLESPAEVLWGDLVLRVGALVGTGVVAAELSALARDEAARRAAAAADAEVRAALLQELHHRVKNDLQSVAALLSLDAHREPPSEPTELLERVTNRMQSIAAVHALLALRAGDADAGQLVSRIATMLGERAARPEVAITVDDESLPVGAQQASCLALVVNELITNALEHAFPARRSGEVRITVRHVDGEAMVTVADDGVGVARDVEGETGEHLGLELVRRLVSDGLDGSFEFTAGHPGAAATIRFPIGVTER